MILTAFGLGIFLGFIFFELTGITAGGIIVPGYLALYMNEPVRILVTLLIAAATYGLLKLLSYVMILYGRRRFLLAILSGFLLRAASDQLQLFLPETGWDLQAIGYIIPGLIANEFFRQGIPKTLLAMGAVSILTFFMLRLVYF